MGGRDLNQWELVLLPGGGGTPRRVSPILQGHTLASSIPLDGTGLTAEPGLFLVQGPCEVFGISASTAPAYTGLWPPSPPPLEKI